MMPDGIKERFELYRKWFKTLLITEFMNLPLKYQERFLLLAKQFIHECTKIFEENKNVLEKTIRITVDKVIPCKDTEYIVCGRIENVSEDIKIRLPTNRPKPEIGSKLIHIVFSLDGDVWYSSKEELLQRRS